MIFDDVRRLVNKKHISKADMCHFLAQVPDCTLSMHCDTTADAIAAMYSNDDIKELYRYWFGIYKSMADKKGYLWQDESETVKTS